MSPLLMERSCLLGQAMPFGEAEALMRELVGVSVSGKQIERVCLYFGEEVAREVPEAGGQVQGERIYAMLDGSMLLTREQGWKEVKLGRLWSEHAHRRQGQRGAIASSAYVAHLGTKDEFLPLFEQALSRTGHELGELVIVADGASWIWEWARSKHPSAVQILDYYHGKEALWRYARVHFTGQKRRLLWMEEQERRLFADEVEQVIASVASEGYRSLCDLKEQRALVGYLKRNRDRMRYGSYRARGLMIGSGPIESAHRNVIQQRMKLAGQRWSEPGAQALSTCACYTRVGTGWRWSRRPLP
ncbi:hypothetical protein [Rhodocaloribacter sp.]